MPSQLTADSLRPRSTGTIYALIQTLDSRRIAVIAFVSLTIVKLFLYIALTSLGTVKPFIGDNAIDYYIPIADRLVAEGRFNGPESRDDSWVSIGYPVFLAATK